MPFTCIIGFLLRGEVRDIKAIKTAKGLFMPLHLTIKQ